MHVPRVEEENGTGGEPVSIYPGSEYQVPSYGGGIWQCVPSAS